MTTEQVADLLGCSGSTVKNWSERGRLPQPIHHTEDRHRLLWPADGVHEAHQTMLDNLAFAGVRWW